MDATHQARGIEANSVTALLAQADSGPAGLVIEGEAGIGKTTVWSQAIDRAAEAGFRILSARPARTEARVAFGVLGDLLAGADDSMFDALPEVQKLALDRVLLRAEAGPATDERVTAAAFRSVLALISAHQPVLVAVDDVQWLDAPSQAVINFAFRRLTGPIGFVVAARTSELEVGDPASWLELPHRAPLRRVTLKPLSLGALHAGITARRGRPLTRPLLTQIHKLSGGNPFYAMELTRAIDENPPDSAAALPASLNVLVRQRLATLSDEASAVLLAAACAAEATVDLMASATDLEPSQVVTLVEEAEAKRILALHGARIEFTHPLLAHGVYTQAHAAQRRAMHRRLAAHTTGLEARARHLALASVTAEKTTLQALDAAAAAATSRGAHSAAAEMFELAINLGGEDPMRRFGAADAHFRAGALDGADRHLVPLINSQPPGALRAAAMMLRGAVYGYGNRFSDAVAALTAGVAEAGDNRTLGMHGRMLLALAIGITGDLHSSVEHATRAAADSVTVPDEGLRSQALTLMVHVNFMYGLGHDHSVLQKALELEDDSRVPAATLQARNVAAIHAAWTGDLDAARGQIVEMVRRCTDRGNEVDVVWAQEFLTMTDIWLGRYDDAAVTAHDAFLRAEQIGGHLSVITANNSLATVNAYRGRADDTRRSAAVVLKAVEESGIAHHAIAARTSLSLLEVSLRDYDAALTHLSPMLASFDPVHGTEIMVGGYLPNAIEALITVGRGDEAEPLVEALERNGARLDRPWMLATGARGRAQLLSAASDLEAAEKSAQQALVHHERLPMPFETLRTRLLLGRLQRRNRRRQEATTTLTDVLDGFERLGADLWAIQARDELERVGRSGTDEAGLSVSEQRVAALAADGLPNREIAAALFMSAKTVEKHLTTAYRKLGIRSRAQLFSRLNASSPATDLTPAPTPPASRTR